MEREEVIEKVIAVIRDVMDVAQVEMIPWISTACSAHWNRISTSACRRRNSQTPRRSVMLRTL